jgi:hypothetical protein
MSVKKRYVMYGGLGNGVVILYRGFEARCELSLEL